MSSFLWLIIFLLFVADVKAKFSDHRDDLININVNQTSTIPVGELQSLQNLFDSTNGAFWLWRSNITLPDGNITVLPNHELPHVNISRFSDGAKWNFTGVHDPCIEDWQGITCACRNSSSVNVTASPELNSSFYICNIEEINLIHYNLTGSLPQSMRNLTLLRVLDLESNNISGTIPDSYGAFPLLRELYLGRNNMSGSIPGSLGNLSALKILRLDGNKLQGTIPVSLCALPLLSIMNLSTNALHGTLPPQIGNLSSLTELYIMYNRLTGTVPVEISRLSRLQALLLNANGFKSSLPSEMQRLQNLSALTIDSNYLTGTLPDWLGALVRLRELNLAGNQFIGKLPEELCSLRRLNSLVLNNNALSGTIPDCIGMLEHLAVFSLFNNRLVGRLPPSFSLLMKLSFLFVNDNMLTGPVPSLRLSPFLQFIYLQNNFFSGQLTSLVNATHQKFISYIDLSTNQFTGPLPSELFDLEELVSFAAVSNCLVGSIPVNICERKSLVFLNLDGMHTGSSCHVEILPKVSRSYMLTKRTSGGIPSCLFNMSTLETLHVSGNAINWAFPSDLVISPALKYLSLSHNLLTGTIPLQVLTRRWTTLDLSYNKLSGSLHSNMSVPPGSALFLQVNRLSGDIPSTLKQAQNISILQTNLFYCDFTRSSLPENDQYHTSYVCSSSLFLQAFTLWSATVLAYLLAAAVLLYIYVNRESVVFKNPLLMYLQDMMAKCEIWFKVFEPKPPDELHPGITLFADFCAHYRKTFARVISRMVIVFVPLYFTLGHYYRTHEYEYAWSVSAAYLSGDTPAMILLAFYSVFIALLLNALKDLLIGYVPKEFASSSEAVYTFSWRRMASLCAVLLLNCTLMLGLNGVYVYFVLDSDNRVVTLIQILIAVVKLVWNDVILRHMIVWARRFYLSKEDVEGNRIENARDMPLLSFIIIFNSIIAPCLANAGVSRSCFCGVFSPPPDVKSAFPYHTCSPLDNPLIHALVCPTEIYGEIVMSYQPPFIYNYQCGSSFVRNYASVYVYMFLIDALVQPVWQVMLKTVSERLSNRSSAFKMINYVLYRLLKPPRSLIEYPNQMYFHKERFVLRAVSCTSVLITFGVVFPPLAPIIFLTMCSQTFVTQVMMGRFLTNVDAASRYQYSVMIGKDVDGVAELYKYSLRLVVPFTSFFYAFFIMDIYGDVAGYQESVWASCLLFVMPLLCILGFRLYVWSLTRFKQVTRKTQHHETVAGPGILSGVDAGPRASQLFEMGDRSTLGGTKVEDSSLESGLNPMH